MLFGQLERTRAEEAGVTGTRDVTKTGGTPERRARCGCDQLQVTARGEAVAVHACSCLSCQRTSGGAFSYSAFYPASAVTVAGERTVWRHHGDSGRWVESDFCPICGVTLCFRVEAYPGIIGIPVGCFADPDFAPPERLYWASRRHRWLRFPDGIELTETQPG
jgi:hypothetical protein